MRKIISFNEDWFFRKTAEVPGSIPLDRETGVISQGWEAVNLPHTWNAVDGQDGGNDYWRGRAMYCKQFSRPDWDGRVFLECNGAAMTADVYLNGKHLAHHEGGYSTFRVELTDYLREESLQQLQLICIDVDNGINDRVYPQKADFTFYGGLYRDVNLICVPESHFELEKDGTPGIRVTPVVKGKRAEVTMDAWVCGRGESVRFSIDGRQTVDAEIVEGKATAVFALEDVRLWDGVVDPFLYWAKAELIVDGTAVDCVQTRFGCRSFSFDPEKGFLLNGRPYPLRGVSRHQDRAGVGNALTEEMHREDMELIKEIGANTVRLAHYQHAQCFYDLADEAGMVVWAEIPYITQHMESGRQNTLDQMRELVTQCYHHPSIVCWGLSNEITASGSVMGSGDGTASDAMEDLMENHRLLNELCHRMDQTRPTTMAHVFMLETDSPLVGLSDISSYNLYFGWYLGELEQNDSFFDEFHEKYPDRVIGFSEYGADANPRFQTGVPERGDYTEQYQALYHEHLLRCIESRPYLWATHVWNMFDFAADGRDEGGVHGLNQKGLVSMDRKVRKDAFYLYKAAWSREPFVHICGRRYVDRAEEVTEIKVYSNQEAVTLFMDGQEMGEQRSDRVFVFRVPIAGEHVIEAKAGTCMDRIQIRKVQEPNRDYLFHKEIVNWFDRDEPDPACFSIRDTMGEIMANPEGAAILGKMIAQAAASRGDVARGTEGNAALQKMMAGMTVQSLLKQAGDAIKPEQVRALNAALQRIRK